MPKGTQLLLTLLTLAGAAACEVTKTESPLSPSVAGPIPGVEISAPKALEPATGAVISGDRQPLTLLLENAYSTGPRPLNYSFEVATDAAFSSIAFLREGVDPGGNGRTELTLPTPLSTGRSYYWRAKAQDGANTGPYSAAVAFNLFTPVTFDKPVPISPVGGAKLTTTAPEFRFRDAPRTGSPGQVSYVVEVASNPAFAGLLAAWQFDEQPTETRFSAPSGLPISSLLYWRVRAFEASLGPWSDTASFVTPTPVSPTVPTGGGTSGSCTNTSSQLAIVDCRRNQFSGHMDSGQTFVFLRNVANDLNKAGTWGAGYGLLRKAGGASCGGYACDIVCQGTGTSQKQWDVLGDSEGAQTPAWSGPKLYPDIRIDSCDVQ